MTDKQISLQIDTKATGRESIVGLADDLENVAKVLEGEVSAEARTAAARLRELAQQDAAITAFTKLEAQAKSSAASLRLAETEAKNYGQQIMAMGPPTEKEVAALRQLNAAADSSRSTFDQQKQALSEAQAELQRFGVAGRNAQQAQQRLRQEVEQVRDSVLTLVPAHQGAASGAQNAAASMVRSHRQIGDGVESISKQLDRLQKFYIGLQSLQGMKNLAFDLAETADQANNLQGRMKLVTGEGDNFKRSWEGATEVALRTHTALEGTGVLFSRIAQAGLDAGLSAQKASQQSLGLTETINQTIQISGSSAEASSAAITQLIQGLQSGVLRGEEFNSVMEQAPRLAKALADGLGVTTGELRKMAESGLLTTQTVITALQGQSAAVAAEFQRLPPTVGRAMQDLSTQWMLYVQEVDQANGASAAAAKAIQLLANNLQNIAGLLMDLGQAAAAFTALRLAQHFLGIGQATQVAATGIAAANAQLVATQAAAAGAAASTSRFAAVMGGLKTFTLVGIVSNIKDIGTWIGESAAKLAGYKDRTEELEKADKAAAAAARELAAARAAEAQKTQEAADKLFDLSKAARNSVAEFEHLTKSGKSSADALKSVTEGFDLTKVQGIKDFAATLDKLGETGKITASEMEVAWAKALSGKDLAVFEAKARAAFLGSSREAERLAQLTEAVLGEAIKRAGLEYDVLKGNISTASRSAINDTQALIDQMGVLKQEGVDTGRVLTASFSKAIDSANSEAALKAIRDQIESVRGALGQQLTDGLLDQAKRKADALKDALDAAIPGVNSVREAFKQLGITSDETLKKTAADAKAAYDVLRDSGMSSARELGEAFKKSADAAISANKGIAPSWVQAEAAMRGFEIEVDKTGKSVLKVRDNISSAADASSRAGGSISGDWRGITSSVNEASAAVAAYNQRMKEKYGRPGDGDKPEELGEGVQRIGSGYRNKDGLTSDAKGNAQQQFAWTRTMIIDYLKQAGLEELVATKLSEQFLDANGDVPYLAGDAQKRWGGQNSTLASALGKMAEYYKYDSSGKHEADRMLEQAKDKPSTPAPAPTPAPGPTPAPSPGQSGNTYVNHVTINGVEPWGFLRGTTSHTSSQSAQTEVDLLKKLAQAKGTAA